MNRFSNLFSACLLATLLSGAPASAQVVISQVNGNGGLTGDLYDRDYVELFNRGTTPVDMTGWSIQLFGDFGTATTVSSPTWDVIPISGTILPGQYFLIAPSFQRGSLGAAVASPPLPTPDVMGPVYDGAILVSEANAVALMSTTTPIPAGQCPNGSPNLVDLFRYGYPIALCFEGDQPAPPTTSGGHRAVARGGLGCDDSNNNVEDLLVNVPPNPRNSDSNAFAQTSVMPSPGTLIAGVGGSVSLVTISGLAPCNPLGAGLTAATANLSALGHGAAEPMFDDGAHGDGGAGDGVFGLQFNVGSGVAAGTYTIPISVTGVSSTTIPVSARVRVFPPPAANDLCTSAVNLSDPGGIDIVANGPYAAIVNNSTANSEGIDAGTCNGDTEVKFSVWYSFTAPANGALRVSESSTEDVVFSIHSTCGGASLQCANREDSGFPVVSGNTYFVQVGRETGASSAPTVPLELTFTWVPAVPNDTPCAAQTIASFPAVLMPYAPAAADEPFNISCDAAANPGARHGAWYTFTPSSDGTILFFENSINPTNLTLFSGANCSSIAPGTCIDETTAGTVIQGIVGGTTYWLLVSYDAAATTSSPSQPYNVTLQFLPRPVNDECSGAIDLNMVGLPHSTNVVARAALGDPGVPSSTGTSGVNPCNTTLVTRPAGVWYTYTTGPTVSGTLRVAESTGNDVFYNVFLGSCGGLTAHQCYGAFTNDDIFIQLAPSTTYFILVGMQSTTSQPTGDYSLTFTLHPAPANDLPCNATLVTGSMLHDTPAGPSATADVDVSCNFNSPVQTSTGFGVWYHVPLTSAKRLFVNDASSDDLVIGLFSGPDCSTLTEIDCKMGGQIPADFAYFNLMPGSYWVLIGRIANNQPFGFYDITLELSDPQGACCAGTSCSIATAATCAGIFRGPFTVCGSTPSYEDTVPTAIPDAVSTTPMTLVKTINVTDTGTISDLKVLIDITHARVGDLIITVQGPGGGVQDLIRRIDDTDGGCPNPGQQGRLTDMGGVYIFDDQSYNPYGPSMPPAAKYFDFTGLVVLPGHYRPTTCNDVVVNLNSAFIGQTITGTWTLSVTDAQQSSTGTLNRWGLIINGGTNPPCACLADFNGVGGVTVQDIFDFLAAYFLNLPSADINGVGGVTVQDIFDYLALYFIGCD